MKPVSRTTDKRLLIALALGFIAWRISVELMAPGVALLLAVITIGCTWALTKPRPSVQPHAQQRRPDHKAPEQHADRQEDTPHQPQSH